MDIIDKFINVRKKRGISQQKLADLTGISQPVIARVESKRSSPTVEFLSKVLDALDLELSLTDTFDSPLEIKKLLKACHTKELKKGGAMISYLLLAINTFSK